MDEPQSVSNPTTIRPGRVWTFAFGAAFLAALIAWGVEEASLLYYGPQMMAKSAPREYRADLRAARPDEPGAGAVQGGGGGPGGGARPGGGGGARPGGGGGPRNSPYGASRATKAYQQEFTGKAVALSGGAVGAMFGLALGLALSLSGVKTLGAWVRGLISGTIAAAICGAGGYFLTRNLVPMFYQAIADNPGSPLAIASLLLIRGVPRMIAGLAGGLALGVAVGAGRKRMLLGALGGMIGAGIGVALVVVGDEVIALLSSQSEIATSPILRSPIRRITAILAVSLPSAAGAAWAILHLQGSRRAKPQVVALAE